MIDPSIVESVFLAALGQATDEARAAYLDDACKDNPALREQVSRLLAAHPRAVKFMGQSASPAKMETATYVRAPEQMGTVVAGRYRLLERIGEGGMGEVWVADQLEPIHRRVALKLIKPGMDSRSVLARFEAERQALALMDHPNIARVFDAGTTADGRPYFVMELVKGTPITEFCDARKLSPRERLELFVPVCQAIQHAHTKGIIHRDVKPSNVLVALHDERPVPKVIDFGVAKAVGQQLSEKTIYTGFGGLVGTPAYMAPEQATFNQLDIDTRSDIYALGVLLYELLAGTPPVEPERLKKAALDEVLRVVREEEPPRPSQRFSTSQSRASIAAVRQTDPVKLGKLIRGELDWIVMKALEKDRSRRYQTANGFAEDVKHYLGGEPVLAVPPTPLYRLRKFVRRHKAQTVTLTAIAALLTLTIGMGVWFAWWSDRQAAERRHDQELVATRRNDALTAALDRIDNALRAQRPLEAAALLRQVDSQPEANLPAELRDRLDQVRLDERTVRELDEIFEERWMVLSTDTRMYNERAKRRYPLVFQSYGLTLGSSPANASIEKVRHSVISDVLLSSLADWYFVEPGYPGLAAFLDLLDPEPLRAKIRTEIRNGNSEHIEAFSKGIDGSQLSPAYAIGLCNAGGGVKVLKEAWSAHPDSFPLALTICGFTCGTTNEDAVGWGRAAVSLRPQNALAHYFYAVASFVVGAGDGKPDKSGHISTAIHQFRRTIELAPKFARAYGWLAYLLHFYGQSERQSDPEAIALARQAVALDDFNDLGHVVLFAELLRDKKYIDALREYQRLKSLRDDDKLGIINEGYAAGVTLGSVMVSKGPLFFGLAESGWPLEAYRLIEGKTPSDIESFESTDGEEDRYYFQAARVAALAGCGNGNGPPPESERAKIRKQALTWLTERYGACRKSLEQASASNPRKAVQEEMNRWLGDAGFAGVRDSGELQKLPADEQQQWEKFWADVRALRDKTAPGRASPKG